MCDDDDDDGANLPVKMAKLKKLATADMSWYPTKTGHHGARPIEIPCNSKETANKPMPSQLSNNGPDDTAPRALVTPIHVIVVDICAVVDDVTTSMSGKVGLKIPILTP